MKKKIQMSRRIFYAIIFLVSFGCEKETPYPSFPQVSFDAITNFDAFWHGVNDNYVFFSFHDINWDDVYTQYRPKVTASTSQEELRDILLQMMDKLIDGHRSLTIGAESYGVFSPDYLTKYPIVNTDSIVRNTYIDTTIFIQYGYQDGSVLFEEAYLTRMREDRGIVYFRYRTYRNALQIEDQNQNLKLNLRNVQNINSYKGLILDLRLNGGGEAIAFKNLVSKFVPQSSYNWGFSKFRLSRDRYETTPYISEVIEADVADNTYFTKPLIILTDRYSFSAAEVTAMALRNLPNVIGDTTGGAQGPISPNKDYTGNFKLPNSWEIQLAQKATFDKNKQIFEGKGLPPDIVEKPSPELAAAGKDNVLDRAIEYFK
jgi:carboxyl-terminal processing protease